MKNILILILLFVSSLVFSQNANTPTTGSGAADGTETIITGGTNVTVTGTGASGTPYVINSSGNVTENTVAGQTPVTNPPAAPAEGDEFINTTDNREWIYDGATWVERDIIIVANTIFVSEDGNNATAQRERFDLHFRDPWAAKSAANIGDLIVVYPGTYTCGSSGALFTTANNTQSTLMNKDVNYYLHPGVTIRSLTANHHLFFDNVGSKVNVDGDGIFQSIDMFFINHANSELTLKANRLINTNWLCRMDLAKKFVIDINTFEATGASIFNGFILGIVFNATTPPVENASINISIKDVIGVTSTSGYSFGICCPFNLKNSNVYCNISNMTNPLQGCIFRTGRLENCKVRLVANNFSTDDSLVPFDVANTPDNPVGLAAHSGLFCASGSLVGGLTDTELYVEFVNIKTSSIVYNFGYNFNPGVTSFRSVNSKIFLIGRNIVSQQATGRSCLVSFSPNILAGSNTEIVIDIEGENKTGHCIYYDSNFATHGLLLRLKGKYKCPAGKNIVRINGTIGSTTGIVLEDIIMYQADGVTPCVNSVVETKSIIVYDGLSNTVLNGVTELVGSVTVNPDVK